MSNHYKTDGTCKICGDEITHRFRNALYCKDCCEVIRKEQKKKAFEKYTIKEKKIWRKR